MKPTRRYYCGNCQQPGHNRATCPDLPKKPKKATNSWRATEWLRTQGGTLLDAAKRFRVTRQAVQQMWIARDLGPLPTQQKRAEIIADLAQYDGMTRREIVEHTGIHVSSRRAKEAGICLAPAPSLVDRIRPDVEELLPLIQSREITVTEAAHRLGVTHQILNMALKTLIDGPMNLNNRGRDYRVWVGGKSKSQRASEIVDAGASASEACARVGVSARCLYVYRKRKGKLPPKEIR